MTQCELLAFFLSKEKEKGKCLACGCTISFRVHTTYKSFKTAKEKVANVKMWGTNDDS